MSLFVAYTVFVGLVTVISRGLAATLNRLRTSLFVAYTVQVGLVTVISRRLVKIGGEPRFWFSATSS